MPIFGILSLVLSPFALLIVIFFAAVGGRLGIPRYGIQACQMVFLLLLVSALMAGLTGIWRGEKDRALAVKGLLLTASIIGMVASYFHSLDD